MISSLLFVAFFSKDIFFYSDLMGLKDSVAPKVIKYVKKNGGSLEYGVLFTYKAPFVKKVEFASNTTKWRKIKMTKNPYGIWFLIIPLTYNITKKIEYKFVVDDIWVNDPKNPNYEDDLVGGQISIVNIHQKPPLKISVMIEKNIVTFYFKDRNAKSVSVIGNFNNWDPTIDRMKKVGDIWVLKKKLLPGKYYYAFFVDGKWIYDSKNENWVYNPAMVKYSVLEIK